jgi:hypothetical protein
MDGVRCSVRGGQHTKPTPAYCHSENIHPNYDGNVDVHITKSVEQRSDERTTAGFSSATLSSTTASFVSTLLLFPRIISIFDTTILL